MEDFTEECVFFFFFFPDHYKLSLPKVEGESFNLFLKH